MSKRSFPIKDVIVWSEQLVKINTLKARPLKQTDHNRKLVWPVLPSEKNLFSNALHYQARSIQGTTTSNYNSM